MDRRRVRVRPAVVAVALLLQPVGAQAAGGPPTPPSTAMPTAAVAEYYTRPLIKARLRIPGSLQHYTVAAIAPTIDDPGRFDVEVRFMARTPFGATTAHAARFQMKRAAADGGWIVTAR